MSSSHSNQRRFRSQSSANHKHRECDNVLPGYNCPVPQGTVLVEYWLAKGNRGTGRNNFLSAANCQHLTVWVMARPGLNYQRGRSVYHWASNCNSTWQNLMWSDSYCIYNMLQILGCALEISDCIHGVKLLQSSFAAGFQGLSLLIYRWGWSGAASVV